MAVLLLLLLSRETWERGAVGSVPLRRGRRLRASSSSPPLSPKPMRHLQLGPSDGASGHDEAGPWSYVHAGRRDDACILWSCLRRLRKAGDPGRRHTWIQPAYQRRIAQKSVTQCPHTVVIHRKRPEDTRNLSSLKGLLSRGWSCWRKKKYWCTNIWHR